MFDFGKLYETIARETGFEIELITKHAETALVGAAFLGHVSSVSLLLDNGADINASGKFGTAMTAAVSSLRQGIDIIKLLLERGADIDVVGGDSGTPLTTAVSKGKMEIFSLLLERGANINIVGGQYGTALAAAAFNGRRDTVLLLLDRGADINVVAGDYGTPLTAAAFQGEHNIVSLLLERGADINAVGGKYGTALAASALESPFLGQNKITTLLLSKGADINAVGGDYGTALAAAAFKGNTKAASFLLTEGADINTGGDEYGSALAVAAFYNNINIVQLLLEKEADINVAGTKYGTALAAAAFKGNKEIVNLLLKQGADIKVVDSKYGTAAAAAAFGGNMEIVSLLLEKGADIDAKIDPSTNAIGDDRSAGIVGLLLEHGADVICAGGCYSTASGLYSSALDLALSEDSKADPALLALLKTAIRKQHEPQTRLADHHPDPINHVLFQPPLPKPVPAPDSPLPDSHRRSTSSLSLSSCGIVPAELQAGGHITPEQADVSCRDLHEEALWQSLAALIGLNKDTAQAEHQWILNDVRYFVACNLDFGLAYAIARVAWKNFNEYSEDSSGISTQRAQWHERAQVLDQARRKSIEVHSKQELIISPYEVMPRRLWDLRSNRVINFRFLHAVQSDTPTFWVVTHSWTSDMSPVWTTVNQHQWGIPLPKGTTLEGVRAELLAMGAEYVWIDVVCLRQSSAVSYLECLKREEWKVDVPTIGNVYRSAARIVRYFNGLGVPFSYHGWGDARHWLQRAWTLQEIADENITINGGTPRDRGEVLLNSRSKVSRKQIRLREAIGPVIRLAEQVDGPHGCEVYELVQEMTKRHASHPVDKISGLFYLLRTIKLPCYDTQMSCEAFWRQCFHLLPNERKAEILFDFPYRGTEQWFPTWAQMLSWPARDPAYRHKRFNSSPVLMTDILGDTSFFISNLWTIPEATLSQTKNPGEYEVKIGDCLFGFYLPCLSQKPIDLHNQSAFTLATLEVGQAHNWVVCEFIETKARKDVGLVGVAEVNLLRKVGVIRTDDCSELLVGRSNQGSVLKKMDCMFV